MESIQKFQDLLKRLFQFEASDLDFGIYRILNYKRERLKKFIQEDLKNKIESGFAKHKGERLTKINQRFEEAKQELLDTAKKLGKEPLTHAGGLKDEFKDSDLGRKYLSLKAQKDEAEMIDEIKLQVFNDLYNFFSRFYEEGDFVPQYRYSIKGHKYAIPYNGEEVKLYWANNEQYYTKTGFLFRDYTFKANGYKIIFRIVSAREELGSMKATRARFFILDDESSLERIDDKTLIIRFQYRELTEEEVKGYDVEGGSNTSKQERINQKTFEEILGKTDDTTIKALLNKECKNEKSLLLYQISRFAAKNTKDYFIHKNLKRFLSEQLDYFIKAEVLSIETLEKERFLDKHITRAKVVREIGEDIIDFLSQIEDFQKRLWEKKKFVLKTEYVITAGHVPGEFHDEIWNNKEQRKEWKGLGFDIPKSKEELKKKKLPIDTRYFGQEFKERLLEKLSEKADLDELLDGLLIKSENWQALNLLIDKFKEKIKCIYIDPPYNTGGDEFAFKDRYRHSSWCAMIADRLSEGGKLLLPNGILFSSIDDHEVLNLTKVAESLPSFAATKIVPAITNLKGNYDAEGFVDTHEYVFCAARNRIGDLGELPIPQEILDFEWESDEHGLYHRGDSLMRTGTDAPRHRRPKGWFPVFISHKTGRPYVTDDNSPKHPRDEILWPVNNQGDELSWSWSKKKIVADSHNLVVAKIKGRTKIYKKQRPLIGDLPTRKPKSFLYLPEYSSTHGGAQISNMFGSRMTEFTPKSVKLLSDLFVLGSRNHDTVLDFFAGSGTSAHAIMKLNKDEGGKRKYILVEMADYFATVLIPRLKKLCYSFNWKNGKPRDTDGISQFFKYQILEEYEDTLDNIELGENKQAELKFGDDYLLKYFLDYETRENPSLLNIEHLKNPCSYKLRVNLEEVGEPQEMAVDIPETFNYLLGLKVKKIKAREIASPSAHNDKKRKYLFILGEKKGQDIAIVWREYNDDWSGDDFKEDKEFIIKELEPWVPHIVYVNGQSVLTPKLGKYNVEIRYIEPEFKKLMEA